MRRLRLYLVYNSSIKALSIIVQLMANDFEKLNQFDQRQLSLPHVILQRDWLN